MFLFTPTAEGAYSRMFAPEYGIAEDPATGSSTGPLAAYMIRHKLVSGQAGTRFISEQGTKMGRRSLLHVEVQGEDARNLYRWSCHAGCRGCHDARVFRRRTMPSGVIRRRGLPL